MITFISGATGSGKTWFAFNKILYPEWKRGNKIMTNQPATFPNNNEDIELFYKLEDIYTANNCNIFIDEAHKLFPAGGMDDFPTFFWDKITEHRKQGINFVTTTQDLAQVHIKYRRLIHDLYVTSTLFRYPRDERVHPILQIIKVIHKKRKSDDTYNISWEKCGQRFYIISKYNPLTKNLYDTYKNIGLKKYLCKAHLKNGKYTVKFYSRMLLRGNKMI